MVRKTRKYNFIKNTKQKYKNLNSNTNDTFKSKKRRHLKKTLFFCFQYFPAYFLPPSNKIKSNGYKILNILSTRSLEILNFLISPYI